MPVLNEQIPFTPSSAAAFKLLHSILHMQKLLSSFFSYQIKLVLYAGKKGQINYQGDDA
ncbi:hypothetical protein B4107_0982 [Bacillus safensis]|nr:hypothetical protein B4107_0982 [Bacillus safensis]